VRRSTARLARACATTVPLRRGKAAERGPCAQHGVALACDAESIGGRACVVIGGGGRGDGADRYVSAHSSRTPWGPNGLPPRRCECQGHACNTVAMSVRCVPSVSSPLVRVRRRQPEPPCAIAHRCVPSVQMGDGNRRSGRGPSVRRAIQAVWRGRAARQWRAGGRKARLDFPLEHHALQLLCDTRSEAKHECDGRTEATRTRVDTFGFHLHVNLVTGNHARLILIGFLPQNLPAAGAFPTATSARREPVSERGRTWHWNT
jgi:hypothetical protein